MEEVAIKHDGIGVIVRTEKNKITFEFGEHAKEWLTDERMGMFGGEIPMPLGEINTMWLVSKLNLFVEELVAKSDER